MSEKKVMVLYSSTCAVKIESGIVSIKMCDKQRYTLLANESQIDKPVVFPEFPELKVSYLSVRNSLCQSRYNKEIRCVWEGDLEVALNVNGEAVRVNDHDARNDVKARVGDYGFQGESVYVKDNDVNLTYLVFSVCRNTTTNKLSYNLRQPFIIELNEKAGTGYSWQLTVPAAIKLVLDSASDNCEEERVGCIRIRSFVVRGMVRGSFVISATYARPWEKDKVKPEDVKTYHIVIV